MISTYITAKGVRNKQNEQLKGEGRLLHPRSTCAVLVLVSCFLILGALLNCFAGTPAPEKESTVPDQYFDNFSIFKAEGPGTDGAYVTYLKKDCYLAGVNCSVTFHYKSGAMATVVRFWPKWLDGETKTFMNDDVRTGPIRKIDLSGTAREISTKDGKTIATRVTFAGQKSFVGADQ